MQAEAGDINDDLAGSDTDLHAVPGEQRPERAVIGRLIRRLRISDPPHHFQTVATTVLRTSLEMAAVAWVPGDARETPIVSGVVKSLTALSYRALAAAAGTEPAADHVGGGQGSLPAGFSSVRSFTAVAGGNVGWLVAVSTRDDRRISETDLERLQYVASLIATQQANSRIYADLKGLLFGVIRGLTAAIDAKDPYTSGHSERVARIAARLGQEMDMSPFQRSDLYLTGLLHDVGKIGIDDQVLKKQGPLTRDEYRQIQAHVEIGVKILKDLKKLNHILPGVRHHHESVDGTGYPDGLAGTEIPLEARILAVADAFDAMSSNRPYRKRLNLAQIDKILQDGRNTQWDADVVDALFACRSDIDAIRQKGLGESLIGAVNVTLGRN